MSCASSDLTAASLCVQLKESAPILQVISKREMLFNRLRNAQAAGDRAVFDTVNAEYDSVTARLQQLLAEYESSHGSPFLHR